MAKWNSKANDVFLRAAEVESTDERRLFLDQQCGGDVGLLAQVESLLAASEQVGSFLNQPAFQNLPGSRRTVDSQPIAEGPGTLIGPYKLLQQIGEGGMGVVYMAEQEQPVRRKVALKIVKSGLDSAQVIARFEAERQALALMDHPNIAKVLDAGTTESSRPYFVMELVKGVPITRFCDEHQLTPRQRLELFIPVCQAVQHAHQKGIIHRDLKPSNVLVALYDDQPVPKVIDFGVAKATSQKLTERTLFTAFGSFIGTLEYMSPEQAKLNALDIDTRSDVYALGVLLYELLTGNTPLEHERLKQTALDELLRIIREDEPPKPSTRLSYSGERLATISAQRRTEPAKLGQVLRGELDWIVMRALEKERTRRYETANGLARDLLHYLAGELVEACPPSAGYRLRKFARKHKAGLTTAVGFAALLVLGTAISAWQTVRATQAEADALVHEQQANANAVQAKEKEHEANQQRNEAQQQRDEAQRQRDEVRALNDRLQRTLYAAHMNLAQNAWEAGGAERVRELLEQHRPKPGESDLRGFEWYYLYRLCHAAVLTIKDAGPHLAYSPDGKRLVSLKRGKVWDAQTGQELIAPKGHLASSMTPDGKRFASLGAGQPGGVKVWDAQTGQELLTFNGPNATAAEFNGLAYSPDGKRLATAWGWGKGEVKVWDAQIGQELLSFKGIGYHVFFSPDGKRLASGSGQMGQLGEVKLWDAQTGQEVLAFKGGGTLHSVVFSPDSKRLASRDRKEVKVWDAQTGRELLTFQGHTGAVEKVAFSPDGKRLASASDDKTVKVWNAETGQELFTLQGHTGWADCVVFSPDGKRLASRDERNVTVWDAQTGEKLLTFEDIGFGYFNVRPVAFSPDGKRLAAINKDGAVRVWDAETGQKPLTITGGATSDANVAFSPDGKRLAGAAKDNTAKVWNAQTGQELLTLKGYSGIVKSTAFSPDGKRLASGIGPRGQPGEVKVWDAQTGQELLTLKGHTQAVYSVAFSPDGKRLASGSSEQSLGPNGFTGGEVKVWDAQSGQELLTLNGNSNCVAFSPDGKRLASGSGMHTGVPHETKVWDSETGQVLLVLQGHNRGVRSVAFSPDGKRLASASGDYSGENKVKVWDAQTGKELLTLDHIVPTLTSVAFSPDGKRLASASDDKTVKVWNAETGQELLTLKGHTGGVVSVAFSPDGHRLVGSGPGGTVTIWDATPLPEKP
jgi:WD40 repeat protein/serine/threonine protein kinase